jgi:MFS family permease
MKNHPLIKTIFTIKGNPRACVYTEPLWGIPYSLYMPYMSVYMIALGLKDAQIGLIATISMISQMVFSVLGGVITDKLGRRMTTLVFDIIAWGIPTFIWAISKNFTFFAVAAVINGVFRVTAISWNSLLVEDANKQDLVSIYTWVYMAGLGTAFFSPLSGLLLKRFDVIPTIRGLFFFAFVLMMTKFIILYFFSTETQQGVVRMRETNQVSLGKLIYGYKEIIRHIFKTKETIFVLLIMIVMSIVSTTNATFWAIIVTERIKVPIAFISVIPFLKSIIMIFFYFVIVPKIHIERFKQPLTIGLLGLISGIMILLMAPESAIFLVVISVLLEAASLSIIQPLMDSLQVTLVDPNERARIIGVLYTIVLLFSAPFGYIGGLLSDIDRRLPFTMILFFLILGMIVIHLVPEQD